MTDTYTKGSWTARKIERGCYDGTFHDGWVVDGPEMVPDHHCPLDTEANAYMKAAAPDMYEALQEARYLLPALRECYKQQQDYGGVDAVETVLDQIITTLKKATPPRRES